MKKIFISVAFIGYAAIVLGQGTQVGDSNSPIYHYNGNVGVGLTGNPTEKIEINGNLLINSQSPRDSRQLKIVRGSDGKHKAQVNFYTGSPIAENLNWSIGTSYSCGAMQDNFLISTQDYIYDCSNTHIPEFTILSNGNVGIGSVSPSAKLEITGNNTTLSILKLANKSWTCNQEMALEFWNGAANKNVATSRIVSKMHGCGNGGEDLHFQTQSYSVSNPNQSYPTTKMVIENDGNVGIGITDPTHKLTVSGTISATEVKVSITPNSDYVFEPDYALRPIQEVETFIKENKHLPDIPSAEEFKENGVGLGEMDDMLLRKVEELTLYVIELKKENEVMKNRLNQLENEK